MAETSAGTQYVVLRENTDDTTVDVTTLGTYSVVAKVTAKTSNDAIRKGSEGKPGVYQAVPARSWRPVTVQVETKTTLKLT